ncbi:MAG: SRPBCC domain-containing protein [Spirochaetaceae bacterium]|nr:SRPBCC domain-containing protein [Spirochaetaceae bacterium]
MSKPGGPLGSPLLWKDMNDGKEMVFVKGEIVDIKPLSFMAYTTIDPNLGIEDIPENYVTVTNELAATMGKTVLTATQGDFSQAGDGERRYEETMEGGGWDSILRAIKALVEAPVA